MSRDKKRFRTVAVGNVLDQCFKFLDASSTLRGFIQGNSKLAASGYEYEGEKLRHYFSRLDFSLSMSEMYDLAFLALYYQEITEQSSQIRIVTDVEDVIADIPAESEKNLCDGGLALDEDYVSFMPVQSVKVVYFGQQPSTIEQRIVDAIEKKKTIRSRYPDVCTLVVSIISEHSSIEYSEVLNSITCCNFERLHFIEYHDSMRSATVVEIDTETLTLSNKPQTITPRLVYESKSKIRT